MGFKILISPRAEKEIENALEYYTEIHFDLGHHFYNQLKLSYKNLISNPYYIEKHKNIRAFPIKKFPYLLFYVIYEEEKLIRILSCFHTSKNPKKYPK